MTNNTKKIETDIALCRKKSTYTSQNKDFEIIEYAETMELG